MVSRSKRRREAAARAANQTPCAPRVQAVAGPSRPVRAPPLVARRAVKRRKAAQPKGLAFRTLSGSDVIASFTANNQEMGTILHQAPLSPLMMSHTSLAQDSKQWSRWRPRKLEISVSGTSTATVGGSVVVAWLADTTHHLASGPLAVNAAVACEISHVVSLSSSKTFLLPTQTDKRWLETDGSDSAHGSIVVVLLGPPIATNAKIGVMITLKWVIEFSGRELYGAESSGEEIRPADGWQDLFTTSDSSYDSTVLTFKMHSGGSMCPWPAARPNVVYRNHTGSYIFYNDSEGAEKYANYFTRVIGHGTPGMVLHASEADALAYLKTGDKKKCLQYFSAGRICKPTVPVLDSFKFNSKTPTGLKESTQIAELESKVRSLEQRLEALTMIPSSSPPLSFLEVKEEDLGEQ